MQQGIGKKIGILCMRHNNMRFHLFAQPCTLDGIHKFNDTAIQRVEKWKQIGLSRTKTRIIKVCINTTATHIAHINNMGKTKGNDTQHIQRHNKTHTPSYSSTFSLVWSPIASDTNINKLHILQNWVHTSTHLHDETHILPTNKHLKLHAQQNSQLHTPTTPDDTQQTTHRLMKQTTSDIYKTSNTIDNT